MNMNRIRDEHESHVVSTSLTILYKIREFTKGGLTKGGLAIYAVPLCNCNALGFLFNVQIENMRNC